MKQILRIIKYKILYLLSKRKSFGNITSSTVIDIFRVKVCNYHNLFLYEKTNIDPGAIIMNTRAKFIMKKNSGAAFGLTVVTGNHMSIVGMFFKDITNSIKDELDNESLYDKDIIVDEDVWIGANVTLLSGVHIGRGSIIGNGSVVRASIPPYAIVIGNPAKVVGFKFTPEEIEEHENKLYSIEERLPKELVIKNYNKYFIKKIKEIKSTIKL